MWSVLAFWTIVAGLIGGTLAALTGLIDYLGIPAGTRAKRIGAYHAILNVMIVVLFLISALGRAHSGPKLEYLILGWIGVGIALISGWLGGELVERLGVGVDKRADLNAPSSV
jgi:uncharacterized membrane protein